MFPPEARRLAEARKAALRDGDKARARELYHQIHDQYGIDPAEIDADAASEVETAEVAPAPERAVKPRKRA